jgi:tripartite-type tricarboxylate transporter receptor subunit TctC
LVVPFSPGGGTDTFARIVKKAIEDDRLLPQPIVIINLDGAGGTIGSRRVKNAKPDGYTILILHEAIVTAQYSGQAPYGPEAFVPIAGMAKLGLVIAVREDSPYQNLGDLLAAAKGRPDELVFAANLGAPVHFVGLRMEQGYPGATFRFTQTGGGTKRLHAVKGGHAAVTAFSIEEFLRYESAGMRALAFCDVQRHPALPDVLTTHEQGIDLTHINMQFWWAPKHTPSERIEVLADALEKATETDYVRRKLAEIYSQTAFVRGPAMQAEVEARRRALSAVDLRKTQQLPDVPLLVIAATVMLGIGVAGRQFTSRREQSDKPIPYRRHPGLAVLVVSLTLLYAAALNLEWIGFRLATFLFILAASWFLTGRSMKQLPLILVVAATVAWGMHAAFTRVFDLILP